MPRPHQRRENRRVPISASSATPRTALSPLHPRPDQPEPWLAHEVPIPFVQAARLVLRAHEEDGATEELYVADLRACRVGGARGVLQLAVPSSAKGRPGRRLPLRDIAFRQLCGWLCVPAAFVRELPRRLQIDILTWGLSHAHRRALLRLARGEVRCVVSGRYAALDDAQVLDVVTGVLRGAGLESAARVRATAVGPTTIVRVTLPNEGVAVRAGDVIEWGFDIGNSELGLRSVQVTPLTVRLVCTNGMRTWTSGERLRLRHAGDPGSLREHLRVVVPRALEAARADIATWTRAANRAIDSADEEIASLGRFGLSTAVTAAVGRELVRERGGDPEVDGDVVGGRTWVYDVANAITATARQQRSVESRLALEEAAARYLAARAA